MKQKRLTKILRTILIVDVWAALILVAWQLSVLNMLPATYFYEVLAILAMLGLCVSLFMNSKLCNVLALLLIAAAGTATYYLYQTNQTLSNITEVEIVYNPVDVYTLSDSTINNQFELKDKTVGIVRNLEPTYVNEAIDFIQYDLQENLVLVRFDDIEGMMDALNEGDIDAVILTTAYAHIYNDNHDYYMDKNTKSIYEAKIEAKKQSEELVANETITTEPFVVFLSGSDTRDDTLGAYDRSDVNIIAVINPVTKNVLFITTPRDYFVPLSVSYGIPDKLTHAGVYGIECSMDTLEMLYGIDEIRYYAKINFVGFEDIVDALGGIDVNSSLAFTGKNGNDVSSLWVDFHEGINHLNGREALTFVRERYAFDDDDKQRGKNQVAAIEAIFDKAKSPSILKNYNQLLSAIEGCFDTNMPKSDIDALVQMQLSDGASWHIEHVNAEGEDGWEFVYSMSMGPLYIVYPDETSIAHIQDLIHETMVGDYSDAQNVLDQIEIQKEKEAEELEKMALFDQIQRTIQMITILMAIITSGLVIYKFVTIKKRKSV